LSFAMPTLPPFGRPLWVALAALLLAGLLGAGLLGSTGLHAQAQAGEGSYSRDRVPPQDVEKYAALEAHTYTLPVLDAAAMSAADRERLEQRQAEVSRAAAFYGFDISDSHWSYRQIECHTLPDHLLLSFDSDSAEHGASHFVAVVPPGDGKVQVVTAYAHGLLPFRATWEKSTAYATFNRMTALDRGEHSLGPDSHWLNLAMCFTALTGHIPQVPEPMKDVGASEALVKRNGSTAIILIDAPGNAEVRFSDIAQSDRVGNWRLRFDKRGRLLQAQLDAVKPLHTRMAPLSPIIPPIRPE
jgi:hypothetical protein